MSANVKIISWSAASRTIDAIDAALRGFDPDSLAAQHLHDVKDALLQDRAILIVADSLLDDGQ